MKKTVNPEIKKERMNAVKQTLKSMIFPVVLLAIIGVAVFLIIKYGAAPEDEVSVIPQTYSGGEDPIILENDKLLFTLDPLTTQFTILVKETGKEWSSTAKDVDMDTQAQFSEKGKLKSTLLLNYTTQTGLDTLFDTYTYSIEKGIYNIDHDSNSVTIHYSLGDIEREFIVPPVLLEEEYKEWKKKVGFDMNKLLYFDGNYSLYKSKDFQDIDTEQEIVVDETTDPETAALAKKIDLLKKYPILATENIYVLETQNVSAKQSLELIYEEIGLTREDYNRSKEMIVSESTSDKPIFNVDLTYRLEGGDLIAEVPMLSISSPTKYRVTSLSILPYFGAGGVNDEGFMVVPEGGGAIINFNNGKKSQDSYFCNMYGRDMCLKKKDLVHDTRGYFNVFGISEGNDSFICTIENGSSYAGIRADISGKLHGFNFVNAVYTIKAREQYDVGNISSVDVYGFNENIPDEIIKQRYRFINSGSYVDMAKVFGSYLKDMFGSYLTLNTDTEAPAVVDIIGAADKVKQIVGLPISRPLPLTTFDQASEIIKELTEDGMKNLSVRLSGWCNGGVNQQVLNKVKVLSQLGGKKGLNSLSKTASDLGVDLYLNGITQYAYNSDIFDGFFSYTDAAKIISKQRAELHIFSSVTYAVREATDSYYLLHPDLIFKMMDKLNEAAEKYNANISYEDVGMDLSSDFYRKKPYSREEVKKLTTEKVKAVKDSGRKQMVKMGNEYILPYVDTIVETDLPGSQYTILDKNIPFFQLAIHGYVNYTGEPLNICGRLDDELLYSAEYGAGLMFTVMYEDAFILQDTLYTKYYGCEFANWRDRIKAIYTRYNNEMGDIFNKEMINHEKLSQDVSCTEYEEGIKVYVNYGYEDFNAPDGTVVPARDYKVVH